MSQKARSRVPEAPQGVSAPVPGGSELQRLEAAIHRWLVSGPDHSTLTLSKRGGSVRVVAAAVHGNALELLEGFSP